MKLVTRCCLVLCALGVLSVNAGSLSFPGSGQNMVFSLKGKLSGNFQGDGTLIPANLVPNQVINLAQGIDQSTPVPADQVLALVVNCDTGVAGFTVYDTTLHSNLVTIAAPASFVANSDPKKANVALLLDVAILGNSTNGIFGGVLMVIASAGLDPDGCPTKVSTTVSGGAFLEFSSIPGQLVITKGKLSGKLVDSFVEP